MHEATAGQRPANVPAMSSQAAVSPAELAHPSSSPARPVPTHAKPGRRPTHLRNTGVCYSRRPAPVGTSPPLGGLSPAGPHFSPCLLTNDALIEDGAILGLRKLLACIDARILHDAHAFESPSVDHEWRMRRVNYLPLSEFGIKVLQQISLRSTVKRQTRLVKKENKILLLALEVFIPREERKEPNKTTGPRSELGGRHMDLTRV